MAAEYGVGALVLGFAGVDEVREYHDLYMQTIERRDGERFVSSVVNDHFTAPLPTIAHWYGGGPPPNEDTELDDNVAAVARSAELVVARLHEANIPVSPAATATFNIDHAYGTADYAAGSSSGSPASASTRSCA